MNQRIMLNEGHALGTKAARKDDGREVDSNLNFVHTLNFVDLPNLVSCPRDLM
jgi:hypothetical protein